MGSADDTPVVRLWEQVGLALIVEDPRGIRYANQTGGHSCLHPETRGFLVPLRNDVHEESRALVSPENELEAYFTGHGFAPYPRTGVPTWCNSD